MNLSFISEKSELSFLEDELVKKRNRYPRLGKLDSDKVQATILRVFFIIGEERASSAVEYVLSRLNWIAIASDRSDKELERLYKIFTRALTKQCVAATQLTQEERAERWAIFHFNLRSYQIGLLPLVSCYYGDSAMKLLRLTEESIKAIAFMPIDPCYLESVGYPLYLEVDPYVEVKPESAEQKPMQSILLGSPQEDSDLPPDWSDWINSLTAKTE